MKKQLNLSFHSVALASALFLSLMAPLAQSADIFGPPSTVDYQGSVLDGNGNPLAPTTPANYEMQFRLYDAQTGGTLVWAEKQLVTVKDGKFSVRLGEGSPILAALGGLNEGTVDHDAVGLPGAFGGKERFLGVTVVIPGQTPGEIQPRLAFLSSPFSYVAGRAQSADRLVQSGSSQPSSLNVGSVSYVPMVLTSSSTLGGGNANILADATTNDLTATLPSGVPGAAGEKKELTFTKTDASANVVTVQPPAGGTINGGASVTLPLQGDSVTIRNTDGNNWWISSRFNMRAVIAAADGSVTLGGGLTTGSNISATGAVFARGGLPGVDNLNGNGFSFSGTGDTDSGMFSDSDGVVKFLSNNVQKMQVDTGGIFVNGGITATFGITSNGGITAALMNGPNQNGFNFHNDSDSGMFSNQDGVVRFHSNGNNKLQVDDGGILVQGASTFTEGVAIGNGLNPDRRARLSVYGSVGRDNGGYAFYSKDNNGVLFSTSGGHVNTGIYADNRMVAPEFNALSDARIKTIKGISSSTEDLKTIMGVEVTDYVYRDAMAKGTVPQKKLIAQQVEKVFPQAVSKSTDIIPDIMKKADMEEGWIVLSTDLKKGEKIRLLAGKDVDKVCDVLEVKEGKFRTDLETTEKAVFVYGREVNDFRTVDYDAVAMLNVSATQQIKKDSDTAEDALRKENEALKAQLAKQDERLAALEKENTSREARLAALESALMGKKDSRTVSTNATPVINR